MYFLNPLKLFSFNATHDFITVQLDKIKLKVFNVAKGMLNSALFGGQTGEPTLNKIYAEKRPPKKNACKLE